MDQTTGSQERTALASFSTPRRFSFMGYAIILITFGVIGGWAATAQIDSASVAPGIVALEGDSKVVQHLEGGIVEKIHVREADVVEAGDILLTLRNVEARANLERLSNRLKEAEAIEARLLAEQDFEAEIAFPPSLTENPTLELQSVLTDQRNILRDRLDIFYSQNDIVQSRIEQLQGQITGLEQQRDALERRVALRADLMDRLTEGEERGVIVRNDVAERMDSLIQIEAALGEAISEIAQVGVSVGEAKLNLIRSRQEFQERTNLELTDVRAQLTELRESIKVAEDTFVRTVIRAPSSGVVQDVSVTTEGSVIRSSETLMKIVPQDDNLLVTARISPMDVDNVLAGQQAEVRFASFNTKLTPVILGHVETVSTDVITPDNPQEMPYFLGRIRVAEEDMSDVIREGITPGMPADVVIVNGERSVLNYLVSPLVDAIATSLGEQ